MIKIAEKEFIAYIQDLLEKGYSEESIKNHLEKQYGYADRDVTEALEQARGKTPQISQQGPLAHSMVLLFVGIIVIVGITLSISVLTGQERGTTGLPETTPVGVATEPYTQNTLTDQESSQEDTAQTIEDYLASASQITSESRTQENTAHCLNGYYTFAGLYNRYYQVGGDTFMQGLAPNALTGFFGESNNRLGRGVFIFKNPEDNSQKQFDINIWFKEIENMKKRDWTIVKEMPSDASNVKIGIRKDEKNNNEAFIMVHDQAGKIQYAAAYSNFQGTAKDLETFIPQGLKGLRC